MLVCKGQPPSTTNFYNYYQFKRDITPKSIAFRIMSLVLQLCFVLINKTYKFKVDSFDSVELIMLIISNMQLERG
jgi:hypothetical protein